MKLKAYAKINLGLKIKEKTNDGYHLLDMVMLPISLCDNIEITKRNDKLINVIVTNNVPLPKENSMTKAIKLMQEKYGFTTGFDIKIEKNIPIQAGLGGGTSDAAEIIKAVNELMELNISLKELEPLAMQVGADVVYSLYSSLSRVEGKGEKVSLIDKKFNYPILIIKPKSGISTKDCFGKYDINKDLISNDIIDNLIENLENDLYIVRNYSKNSLLKPAKKIAPIINKIIDKLYENKVSLIQMSGSGSTIYGIDRDVDKLNKIYEEIKDDYQFVGIYETM